MHHGADQRLGMRRARPVVRFGYGPPMHVQMDVEPAGETVIVASTPKRSTGPCSTCLLGTVIGYLTGLAVLAARTLAR